MNIYSKYNHKDFYFALGYKSEMIKEYFYKQKLAKSDFRIDLSTGKVDYFQGELVDWKVTLINTGNKSMTGGRVKRMQRYIGNETFLLTYGDGLANINIDELVV